MLIIDGSDLVGKTTIVQYCLRKLHNRGLPHVSLHLSRPPESFDYCGQYIDLVTPSVVWDRFHLSGVVYRMHDDHLCELNPAKLRLVEAAIMSNAGLIVVVTASDDVIRQRYGDHEDELYDLEHVIAVNSSFCELATTGQVYMRGDRYAPRVDAHVHVTECDFDLGALDPMIEVYVKNFNDVAEAIVG